MSNRLPMNGRKSFGRSQRTLGRPRGVAMLRPSALERTVGYGILRALRTGVAAGSIVGGAVLSSPAAMAQTDPQVAEFLASVNRSITELAGEAGSKAGLT